MSDYERHTGAATCTGLTVKEYVIKNLKESKWYTVESVTESKEELMSCFSDEFCDIALEFKGIVWELEDVSEEDGFDFCDVTLSPDNKQFKYHTSFYNGGTYLAEMLEGKLGELLD